MFVVSKVSKVFDSLTWAEQVTNHQLFLLFASCYPEQTKIHDQ